ncbi:hypothetical protein C8J57DRAFT_1502440 [Mycena rebaudengoi]|nr:hypothetical protein C8J57DRAFT_1502440 [Mycena rebaudengoi]
MSPRVAFCRVPRTSLFVAKAASQHQAPIGAPVPRCLERVKSYSLHGIPWDNPNGTLTPVFLNTIPVGDVPSESCIYTKIHLIVLDDAPARALPLSFSVPTSCPFAFSGPIFLVGVSLSIVRCASCLSPSFIRPVDRSSPAAALRVCAICGAVSNQKGGDKKVGERVDEGKWQILASLICVPVPIPNNVHIDILLRLPPVRWIRVRTLRRFLFLNPKAIAAATTVDSGIPSPRHFDSAQHTFSRLSSYLYPFFKRTRLCSNLKRLLLWLAGFQIAISLGECYYGRTTCSNRVLRAGEAMAERREGRVIHLGTDSTRYYDRSFHNVSEPFNTTKLSLLYSRSLFALENGTIPARSAPQLNK